MRLVIVLLLTLIPIKLLATDTFLHTDGVTFTAGFWGDNTNRRGWRIAPRWDWNVKWLQDYPITVTGYWEAGVGDWNAFGGDHDGNKELWIISGSEVFQFWIGPVDLKRNALFFEFGIGPAFLTETELGKKDFGGHWHFEDKFGAGVNIGTTHPFQIIYRYYHYSNLGLVQPNNGLDLHTLGIAFLF